MINEKNKILEYVKNNKNELNINDDFIKIFEYHLKNGDILITDVDIRSKIVMCLLHYKINKSTRKIIEKIEKVEKA